MLGRSCIPISYRGHATYFVDQLVNESINSLIDAVYRCMIMSITGSEYADCENTSGFFGFFAGILFQKRNSSGHQHYVSVKLN